MNPLRNRDWLQHLVDICQEDFQLPKEELLACMEEAKLQSPREAARVWIERSLRRRGLVLGDHDAAPDPERCPRLDFEGLSDAWLWELVLLSRLVELISEIWSFFDVPKGEPARLDALVMLLLARREGLQQVLRSLAQSWNSPELSRELRRASRALGRAIRKRVSALPSRGSLPDDLDARLALSELRQLGESAVHFLDRQLARRHREQRIASLDGECRVALAQVMAALAWADGKLLAEEERLVLRRIRALHLTADERKRAMKALKSRQAGHFPAVAVLKEPELRVLVLEQTIQTSLVDGEQAKQELELIDLLARELGIDPGEQAGIEDRVVGWFEQDRALLGLDPSAGASLICQRVQRRLAAIIRVNLKRIITEVQETGELSRLLLRAGRGEQLSPEERRKVRSQLLDIAKTIPALAVFALPGGGILLPVLLKLLPFNLLPSAFTEVQD